jgi:hypothetical protein
LFVTVATEQLSPVVGVPRATPVAVQAVLVVVVILAGAVIVGLILSVTVTVNEQVVKLPAASSTRYVAVVIPKLKTLVPKLLIPVTAELATVAPVKAQVNLVTPQLSAVVGFGVTTFAVQVPAPTFWEILAGQLIVGFMLSVTVTV